MDAKTGYKKRKLPLPSIFWSGNARPVPGENAWPENPNPNPNPRFFHPILELNFAKRMNKLVKPNAITSGAAEEI